MTLRMMTTPPRRAWSFDMKDGYAGRDERVGVHAFDESVEFTYRLIKAMGRNR